MSYKASKSDVGQNDQHLNIADEMQFTSKDIFALVIAGLQIVLPIAGFFMAGLLAIFVGFQIFF